MNSLEDLLAALRASLTPRDEVAQRWRLRRLRAGFRRVREDPQEARRIQEISEQVEAAYQAYVRGERAQARGDLRAAQQHFRQAAEADVDDAALRLAQVLRRRAAAPGVSVAQAEALVREAAVWFREAADAGIPAAEAGLRMPPAFGQEPEAGWKPTHGPRHAGEDAAVEPPGWGWDGEPSPAGSRAVNGSTAT